MKLIQDFLSQSVFPALWQSEGKVVSIAEVRRRWKQHLRGLKTQKQVSRLFRESHANRKRALGREWIRRPGRVWFAGTNRQTFSAHLCRVRDGQRWHETNGPERQYRVVHY